MLDLDYAADGLAYATTANRHALGGRRILLDGRDVTSDALAVRLVNGRPAVLLIERPARLDRSGPEPKVATRLAYGDVRAEWRAS